MWRESVIRKKPYPRSGSATLFVWDFIFGLDMKVLGLGKNLGFICVRFLQKAWVCIQMENECFWRISVPVGSGFNNK
jgi:hypothetical protein